MNDSISQRSQELFGSGYYCAESVLMALAESRGIQSGLIPRIATGFCSGIACTGGMCGAVIGAIMGIGLVVGRDSYAEPVDSSYALTQQLLARFEARHGSVNCNQLIQCNLATEEGQRAYGENHLLERCKQYVGDATDMVMALLAENAGG